MSNGLILRDPRARLKAGGLGLDIYGMGDALAKRDLRHEDMVRG